MRVYDGDIYYVTAIYDLRTLDVERVYIPLLGPDWDITDTMTKKQLTDIKLILKKRTNK
jgi:hypothetical protein